MFLARAAVDDARLPKDPYSRSLPLLIRADVYDMLLRRPRRAGRVLRRASLHVRGLLRGVRPERGWQTPRRAQEARRPGGVPLEHRRHERRGPLPRAPFADKDIASNVSDEAFEAYLRAREVEGGDHGGGDATEMERRVELERERAAAGAGAAEKLRAAKEHIIENILTLCCPRCKQAFVDFDGCSRPRAAVRRGILRVLPRRLRPRRASARRDVPRGHRLRQGVQDNKARGWISTHGVRQQGGVRSVAEASTVQTPRPLPRKTRRQDARRPLDQPQEGTRRSQNHRQGCETLAKQRGEGHRRSRASPGASRRSAARGGGGGGAAWTRFAPPRTPPRTPP